MQLLINFSLNDPFQICCPSPDERAAEFPYDVSPPLCEFCLWFLHFSVRRITQFMEDQTNQDSTVLTETIFFYSLPWAKAGTISFRFICKPGFKIPMG